jgi:hypothetical protein
LHRLTVVHHSNLDGTGRKLHLSVIWVVADDARLDVPSQPNGGVAVELQLGARHLSGRDIVAWKQRRVAYRIRLHVAVAALDDDRTFDDAHADYVWSVFIGRLLDWSPKRGREYHSNEYNRGNHACGNHANERLACHRGVPLRFY